jgi:hypothetical protein
MALLIGVASAETDENEKPIITPEFKAGVQAKMLSKYGDSHKIRIDSGVERMASLWWAKDGSQEEFENFCLDNFIVEPELLDKTFHKIEKNFEVIRGHTHQINRFLEAPIVLDLGEPLGIDDFFCKSTPKTDYFDNKLAFFVVLNFPNYSLEDKVHLGKQWDRRQWAAARIGDMFTTRLPTSVKDDESDDSVERQRYFSRYYFYMDRLLTEDQQKLFPEKLRLNCHNGLRGEIRAQYSNRRGLVRQKMIYRVMLRIIDQSIPKVVVNNQELYWEPGTNLVFEEKDDSYHPVSFEPEKNERYRHFLNAVRKKQKLDPYYPKSPSAIQRTFDDRQIPEQEVEQLLVSVLNSAQVGKVARLIEQRIGRKLMPFDIWYNGFQAQGKWSERELDRILLEKYPTPKAFQDDIPRILMHLGFTEARAKFLGAHIVVDPVRVGGHASGAEMRGDNAHLRTVFQKEGLNYKGYRIGMHELGHCVADNLSLYGTDYYFLNGLPTSAFHEGIADLFAYRNIVALGLDNQNSLEKYMNTLAIFWYVYEKSGVALTDIKVWRWLYEHPEATPDQLKQAVITIAKDVWNQYFAPAFGIKDSPVLSIYNHMVSGSLYLYNYALGNISLLQLEEYIKGKDLETELVRICKFGRLTPDLWMQKAVGAKLSSDPLLKATNEALNYINK